MLDWENGHGLSVGLLSLTRSACASPMLMWRTTAERHVLAVAKWPLSTFTCPLLEGWLARGGEDSVPQNLESASPLKCFVTSWCYFPYTAPPLVDKVSGISRPGNSARPFSHGFQCSSPPALEDRNRSITPFTHDEIPDSFSRAAHLSWRLNPRETLP